MKCLNLVISNCRECPYYEEGLAGYSDDWCHKLDDELVDCGVIRDDCPLCEFTQFREV